jgi:hypothetical protein
VAPRDVIFLQDLRHLVEHPSTLSNEQQIGRAFTHPGGKPLPNPQQQQMVLARFDSSYADEVGARVMHGVH